MIPSLQDKLYFVCFRPAVIECSKLKVEIVFIIGNCNNMIYKKCRIFLKFSFIYFNVCNCCNRFNIFLAYVSGFEPVKSLNSAKKENAAIAFIKCLRIEFIALQTIEIGIIFKFIFLPFKITQSLIGA